MKNKNRILIIDAYNLFIKSYIADPSICLDGSPCGGAKGFLKSLQKVCKEIKPSEIIVVWDGAGGSKKKKKLNSDYKEGRAPIRLNRSIHNLSEEEEKINKTNQFIRLSEYLNSMPIVQFVFDNIEADDVIASLCMNKNFKNNIKVILSSDKDFIQLCDKETILYRTVQKEVLNEKRIVELFGIHPTNFALARAICGDKSDNLSGVSGIGLKTIAKRFSFLKEGKTYSLDEIFNFCEKKAKEDSTKAYIDVLSNKDRIKLNYQLMQLYSPSISPQISKSIQNTLEYFKYNFNQTYVVMNMVRDGFTDYNWDFLFQTFRSITSSKQH